MINQHITILKYSSNSVTLSSEEVVNSSFAVSNDGVIKLFPGGLDLKKQETFDFLKKFTNKYEIVVIGTGTNQVMPSDEIRNHIRNIGFKQEWASTTMAYYTYNLLIEDFNNCIGIFSL